MVKSDCYCNCLVIKTFMRYMYAAIVKHRSIHNTLNIKVKFLCYNVKAYESRARKINMKLFWKKQQLATRKMMARALNWYFLRHGNPMCCEPSL